MEKKVYEQNNIKSISFLVIETFVNLKASLFLGKQLAIRDIKAQYRQSYFGMAWAFVTPLATAIVWIFLSGSGIVNLSDTGVPYPVYAFSGALLWSIISESIVMPIQTTLASKSILTKINFPREALIILGVYKVLFNTAIKCLLLLVLLLIFKIDLGWSLLLFPLALFGVLLFGLTLGLLLTPIGLLYKDILNGIPIGLQMLMYVTPVVYSIPASGLTKTFMEYNPFTPLILTTRDLVIGHAPEFVNYYLWVVGLSIPLFMVALIVYRLSMPVIIERMSA